LLNSISQFCGVLPIIAFILFNKRNRVGGYWVIFLYSILSFLTDTSLHFPWIQAHKFYILSGFTVAEYSLFAYFLFESLIEKKFRILLVICSVLFYTIALFTIIAKNSESFDSLSASLEASLLILYSILYLYEQIKDPAVLFVYHSKKFWIVIAFLLYFSSTLFLFIYAVTLTSQQHKNYWGINNIFDIIKNLLFVVSFAMKKNKQTEQSLEEFYLEQN
jgi:hypothetical protein